jgi:hypothetical protein
MSKDNIQSIMFDKNYWSPQLSKQWLKIHNYKTHFGKKQYHETENMIRFRQKAPIKGRKYRTVSLGDHIEAVMMY